MNVRRTWVHHLWQLADATGHILYEPTARGSRCHVARWHHNIHLIPGSMLAWVCDRYDATFE